jgi:hypothetical protein
MIRLTSGKNVNWSVRCIFEKEDFGIVAAVTSFLYFQITLHLNQSAYQGPPP